MNYKKLFIALLIALITFITAFIIIPLCYGYSLGFINGNQISASNVIGIISVVVTAGIAIFVPWKMGDKQNKIALFEKRFEFIKLFTNLLILSKNIEQKDAFLEGLEGCDKATKSIMQLFYNDESENSELSPENAQCLISQVEFGLMKGAFIFSFMENEDIVSLNKSFTFLVRSCLEKSINKEKIEHEFIDITAVFNEKYSRNMKSYLKL